MGSKLEVGLSDLGATLYAVNTILENKFAINGSLLQVDRLVRV